jgi:hypothetical protein
MGRSLVPDLVLDYARAPSTGGGPPDKVLAEVSAATGGALTLLCVVKRYFKIEFWWGEWVVGVMSRGLRVGAAGS